MSDNRRTIIKTIPGEKDPSGAFVVQVKDLSIDALMKSGLEAIYGVMKACKQAAQSGTHSREDVQNLKDVMMMLKDLKQHEDDLLNEMTPEELEKAAK